MIAACAPPASASSTPAEMPEKVLKLRMGVLVVVSSGIHTPGFSQAVPGPVVTPFALFMSIYGSTRAVDAGGVNGARKDQRQAQFPRRERVIGQLD